MTSSSSTSSRAAPESPWIQRLSEFLEGLGFVISKADTSLFILLSGALTFYILVYVDDLIVTCSDKNKLQWFLNKIKDMFPFRDLGSLHYFLGIKVKKIDDDLLLTQSKYATDLLKETKMQHSKPCVTPMAASPPLSKTQGTPLPNLEQLANCGSFTIHDFDSS
ncbi:hypothetical protein GH714_005683 [Hevea brasiliensis]|uniref:Reverse transcriptase Ty1/copia-type domain-containing protein n=1 Tax=Hevea brasiliensis TaxID=3981 RepID=A0A6A6LYA0_HEVBR|nr:hypothetical protein GH714_005683 [Hevea brasiliensis]